jgi:hypothetical protein
MCKGKLPDWVLSYTTEAPKDMENTNHMAVSV